MAVGREGPCVASAVDTFPLTVQRRIPVPQRRRGPLMPSRRLVRNLNRLANNEKNLARQQSKLDPTVT
jgi:hypothetical protein